MNTKLRCENCIYWKRWVKGSDVGDCLRYPKTTRKKAENWCGEWKATTRAVLDECLEELRKTAVPYKEEI